MPVARVSPRLARQVAARAGHRCEYCRAPQAITAQAFHTDHILPTSRRGETTLDNLSFAGPHCNLHKGDQIEATDPRTNRLVALFNLRRQYWDDHFRWGSDYQRIIGRSAAGRATVVALDLNSRALMTARMMWAMLDLIV